MKEVSTIGLDIAKSVFQVHGVDAAGAVVAGTSPAKTEDVSTLADSVLASLSCSGATRADMPSNPANAPGRWPRPAGRRWRKSCDRRTGDGRVRPDHAASAARALRVRSSARANTLSRHSSVST